MGGAADDEDEDEDDFDADDAESARRKAQERERLSHLEPIVDASEHRPAGAAAAAAAGPSSELDLAWGEFVALYPRDMDLLQAGFAFHYAESRWLGSLLDEQVTLVSLVWNQIFV